MEVDGVIGIGEDLEPLLVLSLVKRHREVGHPLAEELLIVLGGLEVGSGSRGEEGESDSELPLCCERSDEGVRGEETGAKRRVRSEFVEYQRHIPST